MHMVAHHAASCIRVHARDNADTLAAEVTMSAKPVTLALLVMGCTPSYDDAKANAAEVLCERSLSCGQIDDSDMENCLDDNEDLFQTLWPESDCDKDIDHDGYDACLDSINQIQCDDWIDYLNALDDCSSDNVCQ